ncbi:MAG: glycosyltransferase family 4 protein [Kiritimatiellae bacterium]|nr:glycosyltransferase family 4 protein [Kiritimatiellia bacterium]MDD5521815.1 glycosyltransferase family 4 protein [Kiritimatiellia bacterium]
MILIICQVYPPDPASVGQHLRDVAVSLVSQGHKVMVVTADRGYDDNSIRYARREVCDGVRILRIPFSSFGKKSMILRITAHVFFVLQVFFVGVFISPLEGILITTVPPIGPLAALAIAAIKRVPIVYWVMDINPDQAIALGAVRQGSLVVRLMNSLNRTILNNSHSVVTLDRFMAERLKEKADITDKLSVFPPWPLDDYLESVPHDKNPFRVQHGLSNKFVVMYSGNHGPNHPVYTVLQAAFRLRTRDDIVFLFVGGGLGKQEVEEAIRNKAGNIRSLPYQPLNNLKYSLSAADVHIIIMGNEVVGIVHPCKAYGAMAVARPIILVGPEKCHISELMKAQNIGSRVDHKDAEGLARVIKEFADKRPSELSAIGGNARELVKKGLSKEFLCSIFTDIVEAAVQRQKPKTIIMDVARKQF